LQQHTYQVELTDTQGIKRFIQGSFEDSPFYSPF